MASDFGLKVVWTFMRKPHVYDTLLQSWYYYRISLLLLQQPHKTVPREKNVTHNKKKTCPSATATTNDGT